MKTLLSDIANILSSLRALTLFRSALVDASLVSCLNSQSFENEWRVNSCDSCRSSINVGTSARLNLIGQDTEFLSAGSHLVSPRKFYVHHGIYLGHGRVAHYSGLSSSFRGGPIEVTDLEHFANGNSVWVYQDESAFTNDEIVDRAVSRIGESQYKILSNNCEHFCNWCIRGTSYSTQVTEYLHSPLRLIGRIFAQEPGLIA